MKLPITTVDAYIEGFSQELQALLQQVRQNHLGTCPCRRKHFDGVPAYKTQKRPLVFISRVMTSTLGSTPLPSGHAQFAKTGEVQTR